MTTDTATDTAPPRPRRRSRAVTATTLAMLLAVSGLAVADETLVSTSATDPGRQLQVLDLQGDDLEELRLRNGIARPFEVRVLDTDQDPGNDFTVDATMNNLHLVDGDGYSSDNLSSEHVTLSFATNPLAVSGLAVDLSPDVFLSAEALSCDTVGGLLGLDLLSITALLTDPLCSLLADLHDLDLLSPLSDLLQADLEFDEVEVVGAILDAIDLDGLALPALPLVPGTGTAGAFDTADCSTGIGADFAGECDGTPPTVRQTLRGDAATEDLSSELEARLQEAIDGLDLISVDGSGALASLDDVLTALNTSDVPLTDGDGVSLDRTVAAFGQALGEYSEADQLLIIEDLLVAVLGELSLDDLLHLTGTYRSYPALTVDTATAPRGGEYEGTLTVTLVE